MEKCNFARAIEGKNLKNYGYELHRIGDYNSYLVLFLSCSCTYSRNDWVWIACIMDEIEIIEPQDLRACMVEDRVCSECKKLKGADEFYISTSYRLHKRINEYKKQIKRCSVCKVCMNKRVAKWQVKNKERYQTYQELYKRQLRRQQKFAILDPVNS